MPDMKFEKFAVEHFLEYRKWFKDSEIRNHLGEEPSDEWLECVLNETAGIQYSVFENGRLVAVVGVVLSTNENPSYVISDVAVQPQQRGQGIGRRAITELLSMFELKGGENWTAYVDQENSGAFKFFSAIKWQLRSRIPDGDGMFAFSPGRTDRNAG